MLFKMGYGVLSIEATMVLASIGKNELTMVGLVVLALHFCRVCRFCLLLWSLERLNVGALIVARADLAQHLLLDQDLERAIGPGIVASVFTKIFHRLVGAKGRMLWQPGGQVVFCFDLVIGALFEFFHRRDQLVTDDLKFGKVVQLDHPRSVGIDSDAEYDLETLGLGWRLF